MNRLPKKERLHGRSDIEFLFASGKHLKINPFKVVWLNRKASSLPPIRFGISVSKRISKHAVVRNRIKRLAREAYRVSKHTFLEKLKSRNEHVDFFLIYTGKTNPSLIEFKEKINLILERLTKDYDQTAGSADHRHDQNL
jgi:ribonuclease P protein component